MSRTIKLLSAGLVIGLGLGATGLAHAQDNPATQNRCWGFVASEFARAEPGAMGKHSSSHGFFTPDPGEGGRRGVGNVSKEDHTTPELVGTGQALAEGAQGQHADDVGNLLGADFIPDSEIEAQLDPIDCPYIP
jgi:hypothetical protein